MNNVMSAYLCVRIVTGIITNTSTSVVAIDTSFGEYFLLFKYS